MSRSAAALSSGGRHRSVLPLLFALAYVVSAELGHSLSFTQGLATFWPPSGLLLATLLIVSPRGWLPYIVAALLSNLGSELFHGQPLLVALGFSLARLIEGLVGALLLLRSLQGMVTLSSLRQVLAITTIPPLLAGPLGAFLGASVLALTQHASFWSTWLWWWGGGLLGTLVVTPIVLTLLTEGASLRRQLSAHERLELMLLLVAVALLATYIFGQQEHLVWAIAPLLLWVTLRYDTAGTALGSGLVAVVALWRTSHGEGPFGTNALGERILMVHTFIGVTSASFLALATVVRERRMAAEQVELYRQGLEDANAELIRLARTDGLTQVNNRLALQERLSEELTYATLSGEPLSLIMLDVDHFKSVNDTFGHSVGDTVLHQLGQLLLENTRRRTDFVARYGGEEFAVVFPSTDSDQACAFAERIRQEIAGYAWSQRAITVSIGVATLSETLHDTNTLLRAADDALYACKHAGRNRVMHSKSLEKRAA